MAEGFGKEGCNWSNGDPCTRLQNRRWRINGIGEHGRKCAEKADLFAQGPLLAPGDEREGQGESKIGIPRTRMCSSTKAFLNSLNFS